MTHCKVVGVRNWRRRFSGQADPIRCRAISNHGYETILFQPFVARGGVLPSNLTARLLATRLTVSPQRFMTLRDATD
jgi:hypothetical protein